MARDVGRLARAVATLLVPSAVVLLAPSAVAQGKPAGAEEAENVRMAGEAYDRGARAYDAGDHATAAREFARADALVANPVALELAIRSAVKADDGPFAMLLVERAEARHVAGALAAIAAETREAFAPRLATVQIVCPARRVCRAALDGEPVATGVNRWVKPGDHAIELTVDDKLESKRVHVDAADALVVKSRQPAGPAPTSLARVNERAAPPAAAESSGVLSPWWFWSGLVLTAASGAVLVGFAVDTKSKYDSFQQAQPPTVEMQEDGEAARLRTNVFVGVTAVLGVATAVVGIFAVDWSGDPSSDEDAAALDVAAGPTSLTMTVHFP